MDKLHYTHYEEGQESDFFMDHMMAMTSEALHSKAAIAAELAYRDARLAHLESLCREVVEAADWLTNNDDDGTVATILLERIDKLRGEVG